MAIKSHLWIRSKVLKDHVNRYAILGLAISTLSILVASILVSYTLTGYIHFPGIIMAQKTNPALWALDLTPFMFAYWGQSFCYELANTMENMLEDKTRELVNKSSDLESKLEFETNHDHLTGIANQRLLVQRLKQSMTQVGSGEKLAVIILHINSFKEINYKNGSFNANNLLVQFAENLKTVLLEPYLLQANMGMNMVARLQGAQFAMLIPRLREDHHLDDILTKLVASTSKDFMIDGNKLKVTTTVGVALYPVHGDNETTLLHHAISALFYAEKEGDPYAIYHASMNKHVKEKDNKLKELNAALEQEALEIWYQPYFEMKTQKVVGAEAFLHYEHADFGVMDIDQLLPLIEDTLLARKLTTRMLESAVKQLASWHEKDLNFYISVNLLDPTDPSLPTYIQGLLKEHNVAPEYLKLALTEKLCLSDQTHSMSVLKELSELGLQLMISDFCSGYSSFIYLTNFPISEIKVDESLVQNMNLDEKKLNIVKAAIQIANVMKLTVFAGGVVDEITMKKIKQLKCLYVQGTYFSPAVSANNISGLLKKT